MPEHPLRFLDCSCGLGAPLGGPPVTVPALLERMTSLGIEAACVYALAAEAGEAKSHNRDLVAAVRGQPRLYPVWTVGPHQCGEFTAPAVLPALLASYGVRMVRLPLSKVTCLKELDVPLLAELFDALAPQRVPLFIDCLDTLEQASTASLRELLAGWPALPVIVGFPKVEHDDRRLYYLWERFPSFHVELSGYQTLGAIEAVTARFGGQRLVFGTKSPHFTPLQSMLQVIYSRVDEAVRRDMAGGTLRRLLQEVTL